MSDQWQSLFLPDDVLLGRKMSLLGAIEVVTDNVFKVTDLFDDQVYQVAMTPQTVGGLPRIVAHCTCKARIQCSHAAAVFAFREANPNAAASETPTPVKEEPAQEPAKEPDQEPAQKEPKVEATAEEPKAVQVAPAATLPAPIARQEPANRYFQIYRVRSKDNDDSSPFCASIFFTKDQGAKVGVSPRSLIPEEQQLYFACTNREDIPRMGFKINSERRWPLAEHALRSGDAVCNGKRLAWDTRPRELSLRWGYKGDRRTCEMLLDGKGLFFVGWWAESYIDLTTETTGPVTSPLPYQSRSAILQGQNGFQTGDWKWYLEGLATLPPETAAKYLPPAEKRFFVFWKEESPNTLYVCAHHCDLPLLREDKELFRLLMANGIIDAGGKGFATGPYIGVSSLTVDGAALIQKLFQDEVTHLYTGKRLTWKPEALPCHYQWTRLANTYQVKFTPSTVAGKTGAALQFPGGSGMVIDGAQGEVRPMRYPYPEGHRDAVAALKDFSPWQVCELSRRLKTDFPDVPAEHQPPDEAVEVRTCKEPVVYLAVKDGANIIELGFQYGDDNVYRFRREVAAQYSPGDGTPGSLRRIYRDLPKERELQQGLLKAMPTLSLREADKAFTFADAPVLKEIWEQGLAPVREMGWRTRRDVSVGKMDLTTRAMNMGMTEANDDLSLDCKITTVEGTEDLLPLLIHVVKKTPVDKPERIFQILKKKSDDDVITLTLKSGDTTTVPYRQVKTIMLHFAEVIACGSRPVPKISRHAALGLIRDDGPAWNCPEQIKSGLKFLDAGAKVALPSKLQATLRPYQEEGYRWLSMWGKLGINGILADDMGLGKTVQTIALLQAAKESGQTRPTLIVSPTSVIENWRSEIAKFAPELTVGIWHGANRRSLQSLRECNIILTNYPLVARNPDELRGLQYHYVILDEAQNIKSAQTLARQSLRRVTSNHRLCLTGTPIENHLGEIWSIADYLNPGILMDEKSFATFFRKPIEDEGDEDRRAILHRRLAPLMLRRTKEKVVKELPPKTEIVETVELLPEQARLYETIRAVLDKDVQEGLQERGIDNSYIQIFTALLKLRQVCCDPRLLKHRVDQLPGSAKLDALMERLPSMIEDGRRVLIFSQFTGMLDIIEEKIKEEGIDFVRLDGQTADRGTPVRRFQAGEVKVFLLSLKAGGSGLNLTAADTVILYDPWWNPAVEAQAIDRAYRIGQSQPVFAYRFVAKGTIEERILKMQERKRSLASSMVDDDADSLKRAGLTREDIEYLMAPMTAEMLSA